MTTARLERLNTALSQAGLDGVVLNPGPTFAYLTGVGFHLMERPVVLIVAPGHQPVLVLPELEKLKIDLFPYPVNAFFYGENPAEWDAVFRKAVTSLGLDGHKIGVEPRQMRLLEFRHVRAGAPEADYPDASEALASLRLRKDDAEVAAMRRAVKTAQDALEATLPFIKAGMTEKEIASELTMQLLKHGSQSDMPFAPIVSGEPNSANPHASPSDRKLQNGDLLVIDWGARADEYISDLTRTFAVGNVEPELRKIAEIVLAANVAGRAASRPGVPCCNVDKAARHVIEQAGYGQYFTHRTGHGLGLEVHEGPYLVAGNQMRLEAGMAVTVEPGIYLPGWGGVRIEDNVVVTEGGNDCLSTFDRALRVIGD